ncbi:MAG: hypothetical protein LBT04_07030 [Prevotellaceae bacterium]|nr:hypothetical protein [Prevotellaceae bacterium]
MKKTLLVFLTVLLVACAETDEQKANKLLQKARDFYVAQQADTAKIILESIHTLYPRQVNYRRQADTLLWTITFNEITRQIPQIDSTLFFLCNSAEKIAKDYKLQKDEKYQPIGDYEHISMSNAINTGRSHLKPITDEHGNFRFISNLAGNPIHHKAVEIESGDISAETATASEVECNYYSDFGVTYEMVNFSEEKAKNFILFVKNNADKKLKIRLKGDKEYSYTFNSKDVRVFVETFDFALLLKDIHRNRQKKSEMEKTLNFVRNRLQ